MTSRRFPQTDISRRMQAGESIPAYRPDTPGRSSQHVLKAEGASPDATARDASANPSRETRPGRDIPAEDARAAAIRVRAWLAHPGSEGETADIVTIARWVMHATKDMPF